MNGTDLKESQLSGTPPTPSIQAESGADDARSRLGSYVRLGLDVLVIVFSVLLALVLDDWRQHRDRRDIAETVTFSLLVELETNQRLLELRLPYHEARVEEIRGLGFPFVSKEKMAERADPERLPSLQELGFDQGPMISPNASKSGWDTALASDAVTNMGIDLTFVLSSTYSTQNELVVVAQRFRDRTYEYELAYLEGDHRVFAARNLLATLEELTRVESDLCGWYRTLGRKLTGQPETNARCGSGHITIQ